MLEYLLQMEVNLQCLLDKKKVQLSEIKFRNIQVDQIINQIFLRKYKNMTYVQNIEFKSADKPVKN